MIFGKLYKIHRTPEIYLYKNPIFKVSEQVQVSGKHLFMPLSIVKTEKKLFIKILCTDGNLYYKPYGDSEYSGLYNLAFAQRNFNYYFIPYDQEE